MNHKKKCPKVCYLKKNIIIFLGVFLLGGEGVFGPFFGKNLLVMVKLGYTPNFTFLCPLKIHFKVAANIGDGLVGGWLAGWLVMVNTNATLWPYLAR